MPRSPRGRFDGGAATAVERPSPPLACYHLPTLVL